jgi:hypothetical protein
VVSTARGIVLERGWISYLISLIGALILFTSKKDRGLRLYINYRALNTVTIKNRITLLLISEILDRVTRAKIFLKINLEVVYYRITIKIENY